MSPYPSLLSFSYDNPNNSREHDSEPPIYLSLATFHIVSRRHHASFFDIDALKQKINVWAFKTHMTEPGLNIWGSLLFLRFKYSEAEDPRC